MDKDDAFREAVLHLLAAIALAEAVQAGVANADLRRRGGKRMEYISQEAIDAIANMPADILTRYEQHTAGGER